MGVAATRGDSRLRGADQTLSPSWSWSTRPRQTFHPSWTGLDCPAALHGQLPFSSSELTALLMVQTSQLLAPLRLKHPEVPIQPEALVSEDAREGH